MRRRALRLQNKAREQPILRGAAWRRKCNAASLSEVLSKISQHNRDERGSAVVEFVVLALPLFVPFAIYLGFIHSQSQATFDAHNLARQAARAFIISPSEDETSARVKTVVDAFSSHVLEGHGITARPDVSIECAASPCLTPGSKVKVTVTIDDPAIQPAGYLRFLSSNHTKVIASDIQIVDLWRNTQ